MQPVLFAAVAVLALAGPALGAVVLGPPPPPEAPALPLPLDETGAVRMRLTGAPALTMDVASTPALDVSSVPPLDIRGMPALQVGSMPPLEVSSFPALTIASMPPQTLQAEFPGSMNVTLVNPVLNVQGTLELIEPAEPVVTRVKVFEAKRIQNITGLSGQNSYSSDLKSAFGITINVTEFDECAIRIVVHYSGPAGNSGEIIYNRSLQFSNIGVPGFNSRVDRPLFRVSTVERNVTDVVLRAADLTLAPEKRADSLWFSVHNTGFATGLMDYRTTCYRLVTT